MVVRPIGLNGVDTIVVTPWSAYDTALALVSNASGSSRGVAIVAYNTPIPEPPPDDYEVPLAVFPNPVRIGTQQDVIVQGSGIARAAFYTTSGMLVYSAAMPQDSTRMVWPLSAAKHRIVPGTYIAVLQLDPTEHREGRTKRMKILAVP